MGGSSPSGPRCLAPQAQDLAIRRGIRRFAGSHSRAYVPGEPYPALGSVIQTLGRRVPSTRRGEVSGACATRQSGPSSQLLGPLQTQSRPPARPLLVAPYLPDSFHSPPKGPVATVPQAASLPASALGRSPACPYWASGCIIPGMPGRARNARPWKRSWPNCPARSQATSESRCDTGRGQDPLGVARVAGPAGTESAGCGRGPAGCDQGGGLGGRCRRPVPRKPGSERSSGAAQPGACYPRNRLAGRTCHDE